MCADYELYAGEDRLVNEKRNSKMYVYVYI